MLVSPVTGRKSCYIPELAMLAFYFRIECQVPTLKELGIFYALSFYNIS